MAPHLTPPLPRLPQYPRAMTLGAVSHDGPTREQMAETSFSMTFVASGWKNRVARDQPHSDKPDHSLVARVSGVIGAEIIGISLSISIRIAVCKSLILDWICSELLYDYWSNLYFDAENLIWLKYHRAYLLCAETSLCITLKVV